MKNTIIKKTKTYTYEFNFFMYPFSTVEAFKEINKPTKCFYCNKDIEDVICIGFATKGKNRIFHVDCAKKLAEENETEIKEKAIK